MKKEYILLFLLIFFTFITNIEASSKYITVGCKECSNKCYIISGNYDTKEKEGYSIINIPSGYNIYSNGGSRISKIYYKTESNELLFGCKEDKKSNETVSNINSSTEKTSSNTSKGDIEIPELAGEKECEEIIGETGQVLVKAGIVAVRIITPILLFTLSTYEFMKVIPSKDEDDLQKTWKRFGTRCVITVIIMLMPTLLNLVSSLTGTFDSCGIW